MSDRDVTLRRTVQQVKHCVEEALSVIERDEDNRCTIPFPYEVETILRAHFSQSRGEYVFVKPNDPKRVLPVSEDTWWCWMARAREQSGVVGFNGENVCTHTARHKAVTDLMEAGVPMPSVMAAAGMSPATLKRYAKFTQTQQDQMRARMEQMAAPPTRITEALDGERKPSRAAERAKHLKAVDSAHKE